MKKSLRLYLTGPVQSMFFKQFLRDSALKYNVRGYVRQLQDGRLEVFIEGDADNVDLMVAVCKTGNKGAQIRKVEEKPEQFQDFKEFKILNF
jgi:acylphosphatase